MQKALSLLAVSAILLDACVPQQPPPSVPLLQGAALPPDPQPPPIARPLTGFGDLTFGMSVADAVNQGYTLLSSDIATVVTGYPKIDGLNYEERGEFTGDPLQLTRILLTSDGLNTDVSGKQICPSSQTLFNQLSGKYGAEQTQITLTPAMGTISPAEYVNRYTWDFENGGTI